MAAPKKAKSAAPAASETSELPGVGQEEKLNEFDQAAAVAKQQEAGRQTPGNWIPMNEDELKAHQAAGNLVGYNPKTKKGLLKEVE